MELLLVEDNRADAHIIKRLLQRAVVQQFHVRHVERLERALAELRDDDLDVILLDLGLPDSNGLETLHRARAVSRGPIVVLTGLSDETLAYRAISEGAQDFLVKGQLSADVLVRTIRHALERHRVNAALRESEVRRAAMFQSALDGIIAMDADGMVLEFNPAAERMFGWSREEIVGQPLADHIIPDSLRSAHATGVARGGMDVGRLAGRRMELPARRKDGSEIPIELAIAEVDYGDRPMFIGHLRDISDRRRAEEALRRESAFRERIIASAVFGVASFDLDGRFTLANPTFCAITGYPESELLGNSLSALLPQAEQGRPPGEMLAALARNAAPEGAEQELVCHKGHSITVLWGVSRLYGGSEATGYVATVADLTERRRLEGQLRQAQKLESVGQLASGIAHDFNNLLTVILGHGSLLMEELSPDSSQHERMQEIVAASERAASLTGQLLTFARRQVVAPEVVDLNALVRHNEALLRRLIREDIDIAVHLADDLGRARVDPGQFSQVLINLAVNARDAMAEGGTLTIETGNVALDDAYAARHVDVAPGDYVYLAVSDTGVGMDEQVQAHLFEPFFTTKEVGKGTGLGLATCYGIVKECGGNIGVYSVPGSGTTMKVYLPLVAEEAARPADAPATPTLTPGAATVLVAEDETSVRRILVDTLRGQGYTVLEAAHGEEALACIAAHDGPVDLLVTDALMPRMRGTQLAEQLRAAHPELKVLLISGYTEEASLRNQLRRADVEFLSKPFAPETFVTRVQRLLSEG